MRVANRRCHLERFVKSARTFAGDAFGRMLQRAGGGFLPVRTTARRHLWETVPRSRAPLFPEKPDESRSASMTQAMITSAAVVVGPVRFGNHLPLAIIAGPCAMESRDHALEMAAALKEIAERLRPRPPSKTPFP